MDLRSRKDNKFFLVYPKYLIFFHLRLVPMMGYGCIILYFFILQVGFYGTQVDINTINATHDAEGLYSPNTFHQSKTISDDTAVYDDNTTINGYNIKNQ